MKLIYRNAVYRLADWPKSVLRVIDTGTWDDIYGIGRIDNGILTSYHVTDEPEKVLRFLQRRGNLIAAYGEHGARAELGPGLYLSGVPEYWTGRQSGKWEFLHKLTSEHKQRLCVKLQSSVETLQARNYLSPSEYDYAVRLIDQVLTGVNTSDILIILADQPYNIRFWEPEYLAPLGVTPGAKTRALKVEIKGKLAHLSASHFDPPLFRQLQRSGVVGAFTTAAMGTNPELVLWSSRAIVDVEIVDV